MFGNSTKNKKTSVRNSITRRAFLSSASKITAVSALALTLGTAPAILGACSSKTSSKATDLKTAFKSGDSSVFEFSDSCGRTVYLPKNIQSVSPSGAYAQIFLSTFCPDKMVSLSGSYSQKQLGYLDSRLADLPVTGKLYGTSGTLNYEQIIKLNPDVIIDIGEAKQTISSDLEEVQQKCGLPVIFIEGTIDKFSQAYRTLGQLFSGNGVSSATSATNNSSGVTSASNSTVTSASATSPLQQKAESMAQYIDDTFAFAATHQSEIARITPRVLYSTGDDGYDVKIKGSVHSSVLDLVGVNNVANITDTSSTTVSPEKVMEWNPEVVLLSPSDGFFEEIYSDPVWAGISAVQNKRVYEVPANPYEWLDRPPSVQQVLGVKWLGNLLFPDIYNFDMVEETRNFFSLFWGSDITQADVRTMLANSTLL